MLRWNGREEEDPIWKVCNSSRTTRRSFETIPFFLSFFLFFFILFLHRVHFETGAYLSPSNTSYILEENVISERSAPSNYLHSLARPPPFLIAEWKLSSDSEFLWMTWRMKLWSRERGTSTEPSMTEERCAKKLRFLRTRFLLSTLHPRLVLLAVL